jgi:hypothetical protein
MSDLRLFFPARKVEALVRSSYDSLPRFLQGFEDALAEQQMLVVTGTLVEEG